jgi:MoaA/NifB/PqqE/SkfB family radical SAM enzyme
MSIIKKSKTFCVVPFVSQMVDTSGTINLCCVAKDAVLKNRENYPFHILSENTHGHGSPSGSLNEVWNSKHMQIFRKFMIDGEKVPNCQGCYKLEELGKASTRQLMNAEWHDKIGSRGVRQRVIEALKNDYKLPDSKPVYLDLRLGNVCNLKCRMCNPYNSKAIGVEHNELLEEDFNYRMLYLRAFGDTAEFMKRMTNWYETDIFWDQVIELIPNLKKVYLTGGEPTLIKQNYKFLEKIIEHNLQNDIEIFFSINVTNVTSKFLDLTSKFKNVQINCSIDAIGKYNDYIRKNSNWDEIDTNFKKLCKIKNLRLFITPTVQVYNILHLHEILYYVEECRKEFKKNIEVDFLFLNHPEFLDITILNDKIKQICYDNLNEYKIKFNETYNTTFFTKDSIDGLMNLLKSERHQKYKFLVPEFSRYTTALDAKRNENFSSIFPNLKDLICEEFDVSFQ